MGLTWDRSDYHSDYSSHENPNISDNGRGKRRRLSSGAYTYIPTPNINTTDNFASYLPPTTPINSNLRNQVDSEVLSPPPTISSLETLNSLRERLQNVRNNNSRRESQTTTTAGPTRGILSNGIRSRDRDDEIVNESLSRFNRVARGLMSRRRGRIMPQNRPSIHFRDSQIHPQGPGEITGDDADHELLTNQSASHFHSTIQQRLRDIRANRQPSHNDLSSYHPQQRLHLLTQSRIPDMVSLRNHSRSHSDISLRDSVVAGDPESGLSSSDSNDSIVQEGNHPAVTQPTDNDRNPNLHDANPIFSDTHSIESRVSRASGELLRLPSIRVPPANRRRRRRSLSNDGDDDNNNTRRPEMREGSGIEAISDISHYTRLTRNRRRRLNLPYIRFSNPQFIIESNENDDSISTSRTVTHITDAISTTTSDNTANSESNSQNASGVSQNQSNRSVDSFRDNIQNSLNHRDLLSQLGSQNANQSNNLTTFQSNIDNSISVDNLLNRPLPNDNENTDYSTLLTNDNTAVAPNSNDILSHSDPESTPDSRSRWMNVERTLDNLPQPLNDIHHTAMVWRDYMAATQASTSQSSLSNEVRDRTTVVWNSLLNLINMTDSLSSLANNQHDSKVKSEEEKRGLEFKTDEEKFTPDLIEKLNQESKAKFGKVMPSGIIYPTPTSRLIDKDTISFEGSFSSSIIKNDPQVHEKIQKID